MKLKKAASSIIFLLIFFQVTAQKKVDLTQEIKSQIPKNPIVCYWASGDANTRISPPARYLAQKNNQVGRTKTSTFIVTYDGFPNEAKAAFQAAVDIWETLIISTVPIRVSAFWKSLGANVLGSASPGTYYRNFDGAQKHGIWYPISLAEKISGQELNDSTDPDIVASFNSDNSNWDFNTQGNIVTGKYDMITVVLHEIGHGLGITHAYEVSGGNGQISEFFSDAPVIFESYIENLTQTNLVTGYVSPSSDLGIQLTGQALFLNTPLLLARNDGVRGVIYAPATYSGGSSIAHLDDKTYPTGTENSLMTPTLNSAEVIHDPGSIIMSALEDMGWNNVFVQHTPQQSTEDVSKDFPILCQIKSDPTYSAPSFKLFYTSDGTTFTSKTMVPTGKANEFESLIPKTGAIVTYRYYFLVTDNAGRTFLSPGKNYTQGSAAVTQSFFSFTAGPDTKAPRITHSPKTFIQNTEAQLKLEAIVKDDIAIKKVEIEYLINNIVQPLLSMSNTKDSTFNASIPLSEGLVQGDNIKYRIKATDNSAAQNITFAPSKDFYEVNIVSLAPLQDSYFNTFNSTTSDFFGDPQFSVTTPAGFANGAIHSVHPYPNGTGPGFESNFVYQLRVPIKLKSADATIKFDEIVLAEPGDVGAAFGSANFYDYVVVEGSKDGGITWKPFADGYDSRAQSTWLAKWNSASDTETQPNSTAIGGPTLFVSRTIDMLKNGNFVAGNEVLIRFRLFADQLVHGWGWSVDNLKIQIDDTPPTILHNHSDFILSSAANFNVTTKVTDVGGLKDLFIEYSINNGTLTSLPQVVTPGIDQYSLDLSLIGSGLTAGDEIQYRIRATDTSNNTTILPGTGFFRVPLLSFGSILTTYVSDFNSANTDFAGNYFSIAKPTGFSDGAIHSAHPYLNGFGLNNSSSFQFMLKNPMVIDATNHYISFDEIVLAEFSPTAMNDFAVVEGSKDNGVTWHSLLDSYTANAEVDWAVAFVSKADGSPALFRNRQFDITKNGIFKAGDAILLRFRLQSNATTNGWGWAIDNLSIQGPITGLETNHESSIQIYPNPVTSNYLTMALPIEFDGAAISVMNLQGQSIIKTTFQSNGKEQKIHLGDVVNGMYLVRVNSKAGVFTSKIIIKR